MAGHRCPNCGAATPIDAASCRTCGHQIRVAAARWRMADASTALIGRQTSLSAAAPGASAHPSEETAPSPAAAPAPTSRTSKRRRRFLVIPLAFILVIAAVTGYYVVRVRQAFDTINSVSTPASVISGDALGGSSEITIDTGPAQTAIAAGRAGQTPANGEDPQPAENRAPKMAGAALPPPPAAGPASTSEPAPILSQIERVTNGGFEEGVDPWYLEDGAAVTAGGAHSGDSALTIDTTGGYAAQRVFFIPGTTYRFTLWARLSVAGSETAEVGIGYVDENGTRLKDLEPPVVTVDGTEWTQITIEYTPPEAATDVHITLWKPSGDAIFFVDDVSIRSIVPEEALDVEIQASSEETMTVLLMGVDARPGEAIDMGVRPDSLMVLHLNARTGSCRLLSIPRDTRTELPGYGMTKVNHALAVGGIPYQMQVVELLTGLRIDHYVLIDFNGFEDLVDAVGGITVDVPEAFVASDGRQFSAGRQTMSGKDALSYARFRGGPDGDFGRMQRQQQVLRAIVAKASGLNIVASINELLPAVEDNLRTDFSPTEMASIAMDYQSRCTESTVTMMRLEGAGVTYDDPLLQMPLYYIEVDEAELRGKVAALIEP